MEKAIAKGDKEVLVKIVKLCQTQNMKGSEGGWKEFLSTHDSKFGSSLGDPTRRSVDILVAFLKTFTKEEDMKFFTKVIKMHENQKTMEELIKRAGHKESPQQRLVCLTYSHPLYPKYYSFPSYNEEWVVTRMGKYSKILRSKSMIAIDCEMVLCEDGSEAVVKVCAVDEDMEVKLDVLVNPMKAVSDYRTDITGVSACDLEGVTLCLSDVQKTMKKLLKPGTILVGHSLHHDLEALRIDHRRVIDTSFIFTCLDKPSYYTPSLNNLCKSILGYYIREEGAPHVCLDDARGSMKLVKAKLEHGFNDPIVIPSKNLPKTELVKLLLHNIPMVVSCQELRKLFPHECAVEIEATLRSKGSKISTFAIFKSSREANEAFEILEGEMEKDSDGRPQKRVQLQLSSGTFVSVCVRKMKVEPAGASCIPTKKSIEEEIEFGEEPAASDLPEKRPIQDEIKASKRQKKVIKCPSGISEGNLDSECKHVEEIERLNKKLRQRDEEIKNLHKILSSLTRKHGL
ncbi:Small RNA degrading nuclease 3 [Nymphaea thermarum]|nr:Small RNA degrading nuclease 3 [Nymphaea thermarum]